VTASPVAIVAIDGGNSKTDVALIARDGRLLGAVRGPTVSHQQVGLEAGMATLQRLVAVAQKQAGIGSQQSPMASLVVGCLAGADFPGDVGRLEAALRGLDLGGRVIVRNDAFAGLRAGTSRSWGVVVVMGQGVNVAGIGRDGRHLHHAPGDRTSGDWGGGRDIGSSALSAAIRARDGRDARTVLEQSVPAHFGFGRPSDVTRAIYAGRIADERLAELAPVVFTAARIGDAVARGIVDRTADEATSLAVSTIRALRLVRTEVDVVLSGGIFSTDDPIFHDRIRVGVTAIARRARVVRSDAPPVVGAALLGLDQLQIVGRPEAEARLRAGLTLRRLSAWRVG
jgi:N-acetylglucosamine kinase-like BadF-type ATPase